METMLGQFQSDLGNISGEIQTLQEQSLSMNVKLKNRKSVQVSLTDFVDGMSISPELADKITSSEVDGSFLREISKVDAKLDYVSKQPDDMPATAEAHAELQMIAAKAAARLREAMLQKIHAVRKPMSNLQVQQGTLVGFCDGFQFLSKHSKEIAAEIKTEYIETFSKVHWSYFKTYVGRLMKLQFDELTDKDDLMGADDTKKTSFFSSKPSLKSKSTVFTLGNRAAILTELKQPILVPHTAKEGGKEGKETRYPYEKLFRSIQFAMMDNCAREYAFCLQFFGMNDERAIKFFSEVMGKTMGLLLKHEETRIANWYDSISLVLCARVIGEYQKSLRSQNIPCLEPYYGRLLGIIWPRFEYIVHLHVASIAEVNPSKIPKSQPLQPHYIVRRYAEYSGALLVLNEHVDFQEVTNGLELLRQEVANFIFRMAAEFPGRKEQLIFLINNYDMMIAVYNERTNLQSQELDDLRSLLQSRITEYATEELQVSFGAMIAFVRRTEQELSRASNPSDVAVDERNVEALIRGFAQDWKAAIGKINAGVMTTFSNFMNGTAILQAALTQLVMTYDRFSTILKQPPFKRAGGWGPDLIDKHHVMVEVKKYKTTF
jgi:hypothetical protein